MGKRLRNIGKFYSSIFMGNIGLIIFIGLFFVLFQEHGWFPNEELYEISQLVYLVILPVCIGYAGGERIAGKSGGILAVLMVAGALQADLNVGILAAMIAGPLGGAVWKYAGSRMKERSGGSLQMLSGNLLTGILGGILAILAYEVLAPLLLWISSEISTCLKTLVEYRLLVLMNVLIEPLKVLFLNNIVNHGILVPLGMSQMQEAGKSVLFLLEANPGPGFGMLAALFVVYREKRQEYGTAMFAQGAGGVHEVYFPFVLENLWLVLPLIAGGAAGTLWFELTDTGLTAPVSPGSIITILLMAGKENLVGAAGGMVISAGVSFLGSMLVLRLQGKQTEVTDAGSDKAAERHVKTEGSQAEEIQIEEKSGAIETVWEEKKPCDIEEVQIKETPGVTETVWAEENPDSEEDSQTEETKIQGVQTEETSGEEANNKEEKKMAIKKIGFICDAGVGSSAMGAALFRRKLMQSRIPDVEVQAYASDQIPEDLDLIVCQKDFLRLLPEGVKDTETLAVDSLMGGEAFDELIITIQERNR